MLRRITRSAVGLVALLVLATACAKAGSVNLSPAKPASVEGLPLPAPARTYPSTLVDTVQYTVPGATEKQVDDWYMTQLPAAQAWKTWSPCTNVLGVQGTLGDWSFRRMWQQPGEVLITVTNLTSNFPPGAHVYC